MSLFIEILQSKTSKMKLVAFVAGANRHADFFLALGDHLTMASEVPVYDPNAPSWILPVLQGTSSPANVMGSFVKQLLPEARAPAPPPRRALPATRRRAARTDSNGAPTAKSG